jgi:hypothetical protein
MGIDAGQHNPLLLASAGKAMAPRERRSLPMLGYIVHRVLATIPVMAFVALFVFSLLYIAPGGPAAVSPRRRRDQSMAS